MIRRLVPAALLLVVAAGAVGVNARADEGVAAPPAAETKAAAEWFADFDKAVAKAKAEKKDLFVDFTGSDWCGWCIRLHNEVLKHDTFLGPAGKEYVLVSLDFPHGEEAKAKVPNEKRNQELQAKYGIQGFPTVLLMTADGDVYARTGYQQGGPEKYVEHLTAIRAKGRPELDAAIALAAEAESAKGDARIAAFEKVFAKLDGAGDDAAWTAKLHPTVRAAMAADADNAKGMKLRGLEALLKAGQVDDTVRDAAKQLDPKNEKGLREKVVMAQMRAVRDLDGVRAAAQAVEELVPLGFKDKETQISLLANAAFFNFQHLGDKEKAVVLAKKLKEIADPANERLQALLEKILGDEAKAPAGEKDGAKKEEAPKDGPDAGPEKDAK
jgi:thioredoxin-related protein